MFVNRPDPEIVLNGVTVVQIVRYSDVFQFHAHTPLQLQVRPNTTGKNGKKYERDRLVFTMLVDLSPYSN